MKFQAILPNRDFIMDFSLLVAKALGEALQNAFPHRACQGKQQGCLGEEALLYAFPPSACPPKTRCKAPCHMRFPLVPAHQKFAARHHAICAARHCPNSGQGTSIRPLSVMSNHIG
jgi:hypothetical protein